MANKPITKGNINGFSSVGGYWKDGKFYPNEVVIRDPYNYLNDTGVSIANQYAGQTVTIGSKTETSFEDDGHGVITARMVFQSSSAQDVAVGSSHPKYGYLKCYRSAVQQNGSTYTTTAEYIGLASGKTKSSVVLSGDFGTTLEKLKSIKNWNEFEQYWDSNKNEIKDTTETRNLGINGRTSFLAPNCNISGYFFTSNPGDLSGMAASVGKTGNTLPFNSEDASFYNNLPNSTGKNATNKFILSGVSHERFAHLIKIKFSYIYSANGWNNMMYK